MNLEQAIEHCMHRVEENRAEAIEFKDKKEFIESNDRNPKGIYDKAIANCEGCAEDHEQLAEWLEELRKYRGKIEDLIDRNLTYQEFCFYVIDIYMNAIEKEKP